MILFLEIIQIFLLLVLVYLAINKNKNKIKSYFPVSSHKNELKIKEERIQEAVKDKFGNKVKISPLQGKINENQEYLKSLMKDNAKSK